MHKIFNKFTILTLFFIFTISLSFTAGTWVAKVDGTTVSATQFKTMLSAQKNLAEITQGRSLDYQFKNKKFQQQIIQMQIMQQLMVNEVKKINQTKHFVSASSIHSKKEALSNLIEKALWLSAYQNKVLRPQITISNQAITQFYNSNKTKIFKGASKSQATPFIKEELMLQQVQPLLMQLQNKIKSEHSVNINSNFFK